MISNNEKLNKFHQAINHYAEEQRKKIEQEVEEFKKRELDEAESEVLAEAYRMIQKEMAEMRGRITREIAHREMDARRALLEKRGEITRKVFAAAREKLLDFAGSAEYGALLEKFARALGPVFRGSETAVIFLKPSDMAYRDRVAQAYGGPCEIRPDAGIAIGGLRAQDSARGLAADETLDAALEDQLEWFEENSGLAAV